MHNMTNYKAADTMTAIISSISVRSRLSQFGLPEKKTLFFEKIFLRISCNIVNRKYGYLCVRFQALIMFIVIIYRIAF